MSSCSGKIRYSSKRRARDASKRAANAFGHKMYVYKCAACRGFHLTSMKRSTFRRMRDEIDVIDVIDDSESEGEHHEP